MEKIEQSVRRRVKKVTKKQEVDEVVIVGWKGSDVNVKEAVVDKMIDKDKLEAAMTDAVMESRVSQLLTGLSKETIKSVVKELTTSKSLSGESILISLDILGEEKKEAEAKAEYQMLDKLFQKFRK